ncbi:MAG: nuclear transport factor 2 family protein [Gemmatimonadota bacterium]|nr:nuclear transport factor 2 family protein [Gemmatimonadota bacterium]
MSWILVVCCFGSCSPTPPETAGHDSSEDELAVLAAVQGFFDTMNSKDPQAARRVLDPEGDFVSVRWNEAGERIVRRAENIDYLEELRLETETYLERMWDPEVRIHGPIASVWTPYDFYIDGEFSHCGVDVFQLLRQGEGWVITSGTYTVERSGCPESPLGRP